MLTFTKDEMETQGIEIQYRLRLAGFNQTKLAKELGVNRSWVSRVVNGSGSSKRVKALIAEKLGWNPWENGNENGQTNSI